MMYTDIYSVLEHLPEITLEQHLPTRFLLMFRGIYKYEAAMWYEYHPNHGEFRLESAYGLTKSIQNEYNSCDFKNFLKGSEELIINNEKNFPQALSDIIKNNGFKNGLLLRIKKGQSVCSVIALFGNEEVSIEVSKKVYLFKNIFSAFLAMKEKVNQVALINQVAMTLNATLMFNEVISIAISVCEDIIKARQIIIFLQDEARSNRFYVRQIKNTSYTKMEIVLKDSVEVVKYFLKYPFPIHKSEVKGHKLEGKMNDWFCLTGCDLCVPLVKNPLLSSGRVIGYFFMGGFKAGEEYFYEQKEFLSSLFGYITAAFENSRNYMKATTDSLTGLFVRRYFEMRMEEEIKKYERYERPLSMVMLDIDFFKKINDKYGHQSGDYVLKEITTILKKNFRRIDIICRYGGEEFAVILPDTKLKDAALIVERLRNSVEDHKFSEIKDGHVTISAGVSNYSLNMKVSDFISNADKALYKAKNNGRNRVEIFSPAI